jgi:hypothetical protein
MWNNVLINTRTELQIQRPKRLRVIVQIKRDQIVVLT